MSKETLLKFSFEMDDEATEKEVEAVDCLLKIWNPELEKQTLDAFIKFYNEEMKYQWGPDDEEESKVYWPEIETHEQLLEAISKAGKPPFEFTSNEPPYFYALSEDDWFRPSEGKWKSYGGRTVILQLNCPWDDHGWGAVFINEKFVKVDRDIVDCVWLD